MHIGSEIAVTLEHRLRVERRYPEIAASACVLMKFMKQKDIHNFI